MLIVARRTARCLIQAHFAAPAYRPQLCGRSFAVLSPAMSTLSASPPPAKRLRELSPASATNQKATNGHLASKDGAELEQQNGDSSKGHKGGEKKRNHRFKSKRKGREKTLERFGEEPIHFDVCDMLGWDVVERMLQQGKEVEWENKFEPGHQIEVQIERISAHGDGLALAPSGDWIIAVPHCLPGETVLARVYSNERLYSKADLVKVIEVPAESSQAVQRKDDLIGCKYFGQCSGCQYQMIDYDSQLRLKQDVVSRAFKHYSGLPADQLPATLSTLPSPLQYNYRTKLTPHFELPKEIMQQRKKGNKAPSEISYTGELPIGLNKMGGKSVLDIEECPIATRTINRSLPKERERIRSTITSFKNGATVLLRDSLCSFDSAAEDRSLDVDAETESITDHRAVVKERVLDVKFDTPAGAFFQNNRSILPTLLAYVKEQVTHFTDQSQENYLVDAYCGSGLFAICLASMFKKVSGVEVSQDSIRFAKQNVDLNKISNVDFIAGDAQEIFKHISFPSDQTTVVIDPPRRGCDEPFIKQLLALCPRLIIYVSCNVHTQARDVGQIVRGGKYTIKSIRGADLFPQTYHVEGVCVLQRNDL